MPSRDDEGRRPQQTDNVRPPAEAPRRPQGRHAAGAEGARPLFAGERRARRMGGSPEATSSNRAVSPRPVKLSVRGRSNSPYAEGKAIPTRNPAKIVAIVAVSLVVAGVLGFLAFRIFAPGLFGTPEEQKVETGKLVQIVVPDGTSASEIAQLLYNNGVISSTKEFSQELHAQKADSALKSGAYQFTAGQSISSIVSQLVAGPNDTSGKITIPEGLTVAQTAKAVESGLGIPADSFIAQAKASNYATVYGFVAGVSDNSLEGYLAPQTYDFSGKEATADDVIRAMLTQWQAEAAKFDFSFAELNLANAYKVQMNDYDIIKLASIIEREAVTPEDRPLVSSVFYNRMREGMALQSDATMMYVTGGEVTSEDLKIESPYNTYLNKGLPPTPICCPSWESVQAALNPAETNFLFFYIVEDGTRSIHDFSETYEEHLAAIERAQQG